MVFMSASRSASGNCPTEGWHDVRDAFVLEQRRPHFDDADPARQRRTGNPETLLQGGHVDRNLEREAGSEPIENAGGGRVGHLRHLLGPGIVGPHHLEDGADCQRTRGEPARAVEERSPVDVPVLIFVKEIEQSPRKVGRLPTLHDRSSLRDPPHVNFELGMWELRQLDTAFLASWNQIREWLSRLDQLRDFA